LTVPPDISVADC